VSWGVLPHRDGHWIVGHADGHISLLDGDSLKPLQEVTLNVRLWGLAAVNGALRVISVCPPASASYLCSC